MEHKGVKERRASRGWREEKEREGDIILFLIKNLFKNIRSYGQTKKGNIVF